MLGWRNKNTGIVHAHSLLTDRQAGFSGCGRVQLWESGSPVLRLDFESIYEMGFNDRRCAFCVQDVERRRDWLNEWLGVA